jgi:hypothetical protein
MQRGEKCQRRGEQNARGGEREQPEEKDAGARERPEERRAKNVIGERRRGERGPHSYHIPGQQAAGFGPCLSPMTASRPLAGA